MFVKKSIGLELKNKPSDFLQRLILSTSFLSTIDYTNLSCEKHQTQRPQNLI